jgi:hypothetical protein
MSRFVSIAGNEEAALEAFYVAELMRVLAAKAIMSPVLVDAGGARGPKSPIRLLDARDPSWPRAARRIAGTDAAAVRAESLPGLRAAWGRKGGAPAEDRVFFVFASAGARAEAAAAAGRVLYFAKSSSGTASCLYALVRDAARLSPRPLSIAVAVTGCERIEDAAAYYRELSSELKGLGRSEDAMDFSFAGTLAYDRERMASALAVGSTYGELFPEDALAGRLAFIGRNIARALDDAQGEETEDPTEAVAALPRREDSAG